MGFSLVAVLILVAIAIVFLALWVLSIRYFYKRKRLVQLVLAALGIAFPVLFIIAWVWEFIRLLMK